MNEEKTLIELIEWIDKRISELPEKDSVFYKNMKESLNWELEAVRRS